MFDELQKFASVLFSKLIVPCDEISLQDGTPAVYLMRRGFRPGFPVGKLF